MAKHGSALSGIADGLSRITRTVHDDGAGRRERLGALPSDGGFGAMVELRTALLAGGLPMSRARAVYRYRPDAPSVWATLAASGWLDLTEGRVGPTDLSRRLSGRLMQVHDEVTTQRWGEPVDLLALTTTLVGRADGDWPAFTAWREAGTGAARTTGGRLFISLTTLRYLRADAHAAAWEAAGYDARSTPDLDPGSPERQRIEVDTDERHAAALATTPAVVADLARGVATL